MLACVHKVLMLGPLGAGTSMPTQRLATILPGIPLADIYDFYPPAPCLDLLIEV
jgi:predicted ATPase with chaperone activity